MKKQYVNVSTFFDYFLATAMVLLCAESAFSQSSENQQVVFEGTLTDTSGSPINLAGASLTFYISANGCYLYGETSSLAGDSQGNILHRIGSGAMVPGSPNSFTQNLFFGTVSGTTTFAGNDCSVTATHTRLAQVTYPVENISATIKIGTVPYARNATTLNGKSETDFVQISAKTNTILNSGSVGQFLKNTGTGLEWVTLGSFATKSSLDLASADVTGTLPVTSLPSLSGDVSTIAGSSTTTIQSLRGIAFSATVPVSGQVLYFNGSSWGPMGISAGTVTNITAGNGLLGGSITSSGTLSVNFGQSSGSVAAGNDLRIVQALQSVNNLSDLGSSTTARTNLGLGSLAQKNSINLTTDVTGILPIANGGSKWASHTNGISVVSNTAIGTSIVPTTIKLYAEASSAGQVAQFTNTSSNGYGVRIDVQGTSTNEYALNVNTGLGSAFMVQNDGKVGVGTMTPSARLHLASGSLSLAPLKFTSSNLQTSATAGSVEYDGVKLFVTNDSASRRSIVTADGLGNVDEIQTINTSGNLSLNPSNTLIVNGKLNVYHSSTDSEVAKFQGTASGTFMTFINNGLPKGSVGYGTSATHFANIASGGMVLQSQSEIHFGTGNTAHVTITPAGKVGIGTTTPTGSATLIVSGTVRSTAGGFEFPDGSVQASAVGGWERLSITCTGTLNCFVTCSPGKKVVGGGCSSGGITAYNSYPSADNVWKCEWSTAQSTSIAYAICMKVP